MLVAAEILLPVLADDRRQPWPADMFPEWEAECAARFGGWTFVGVVNGAWTDDSGVVVADESRCYRVGIEPARMDELRAFVRETCVRFRQRCIFLQMLGPAELVYP